MATAGTVTAGSITAYIGTIYEDAMFIARDQTVMSGLVTTFTDQRGIAPRKSSEYEEGTVASVAETDDLASQQFTPSVIATLTPGEYGGQFLLTDQRVESDPFGVQQDAAMELGNAMAQSVDVALLGDLASLTGGTVDVGAGTALTWSDIMDARSLLRAQNAPPPYRCVLHEYQWLNLAKEFGTVEIQPATTAIQNQFYVGRLYGVDFYTTNSLSPGTVVTGGMFSPTALALDVRRAARMEPERNASLRSTELNLTMLYAHGVWRPKFGIQLIGDASAP